MAHDPVLAWLLEPSEPSMRYLASRDLVVPRPPERTLARLRAEVPQAGWAARILDRQKDRTYWATEQDCYRPKFRSTIWQLQVLADLGLSRRDDRIANAVELWFRLHYSPRDGGYSPGLPRERWYGSHLCTTGNMVRSLIRLGYLDDDRVQSAIRWLVDEQYADGGWDCFRRNRGTIDAWEAMSALAEIPQGRRGPDVRRALADGAEFFLRRRLLHEGPRFARWSWCRYPWHYHYDFLVGLDFLSSLGHGRDPRMGEALAHLAAKRRADGRWNLDHPNGDLVVEPRHRPSKMITFLARRVARRVGGEWRRRIEGPRGVRGGGATVERPASRRYVG